MDRGILYVCFGKEFDEALAGLTQISRKNTDLPITVLSNTPAKSSKWDKFDDINFEFFDMKQGENRQIKTQAVFHSPYKETILLDSDTLIQKPGIEKVFSLLGDVDIVTHPVFNIQTGSSYFKIYIDAIKTTDITPPLAVYSGGFLVFKKNQKVQDFFNLWHQYWKLLGSGREMPALACALKNSNIKIKELSDFFAYEKKDKNCIIQHNYWEKTMFFVRKNLFRKLGIPDPNSDKSFDDNDNNDWEMVECS
jgi:hypothetical protein